MFPDTRFDDWTRRDVGSFAKRYYEPLWRVALLDLPGVDAATAHDLAQGFLLRELERAPVFERFDPSGRHQAKFRTYLRTCFYRFCRDELVKERRRRGRSLEDLPAEPPAAGGDAFERLVVRDLLRTLRGQVLSELPPEAARYFTLKWPADLDASPRTDLAVGEALGLSRGKLRTIKRKVIDRLLLALRQQLRSEGLTSGEVDRALAGYLAVLSGEDAGQGSEGSGPQE